ncbi:hypothetical protein GDO78_000950 [Eleutherodactylus coqui]|uniref:Uncharacterized protein n=1 Tax=Eleutherodactylus coqui TaxID=57060 RepID=A0A8J6KID9_ELECQ|nr:hypothetical protein GDO78_000950 [Eleutherodactylus coqui]
MLYKLREGIGGHFLATIANSLVYGFYVLVLWEFSQLAKATAGKFNFLDHCPSKSEPMYYWCAVENQVLICSGHKFVYSSYASKFTCLYVNKFCGQPHCHLLPGFMFYSNFQHI